MILGMLAGAVLVLCLLAIRDEFRRGESLHIGLREARPGVADLVEFPLPPSWSRDDVLRTFAEIEAL